MKEERINFNIQYKEVADVAKKIEKLAHELAKEASKEDSSAENDVYGYASDIVDLVRTITPVMVCTPANGPLFSEIPHFIKFESAFCDGGLQVFPDKFKG